MEPREHDRDPARRGVRRRVVVGLLATAAIAVPSIAIASAGGGAGDRPGGGAPPTANEELPGIWMQEGERGPSEGRRHHDRDCPKDGHGRKGGRDGSGTSGGGDADQRQL